MGYQSDFEKCMSLSAGSEDMAKFLKYVGKGLPITGKLEITSLNSECEQQEGTALDLVSFDVRGSERFGYTIIANNRYSKDIMTHAMERCFSVNKPKNKKDACVIPTEVAESIEEHLKFAKLCYKEMLSQGDSDGYVEEILKDGLDEIDTAFDYLPKD